MKFANKMPIDIFEFLKSGKFDYIKIRQAQEGILKNFPDPDVRDMRWERGTFNEGSDF